MGDLSPVNIQFSWNISNHEEHGTAIISFLAEDAQILHWVEDVSYPCNLHPPALMLPLGIKIGHGPEALYTPKESVWVITIRSDKSRTEHRMLSEAASLSSVQDPFLDLMRSKASFTTTHVEKHEELNLFFPSSFSIILPDPDHVSVEAKGLEVLNYTSKQKDTKKMFTQEEWPVSDVVTAAQHISGTLTLLTLHQVLSLWRAFPPLLCIDTPYGSVFMSAL